MPGALGPIASFVYKVLIVESARQHHAATHMAHLYRSVRYYKAMLSTLISPGREQLPESDLPAIAACCSQR